jgi:hypothetical protein
VNPQARGYDADALAREFDIAPSMAAEIVYVNDEADDGRWQLGPYAPDPWPDWPQYGRFVPETPEQRWARVRAWVAEQLHDEGDNHDDRR